MKTLPIIFPGLNLFSIPSQHHFSSVLSFASSRVDKDKPAPLKSELVEF